jgi:hypothetical protein
VDQLQDSLSQEHVIKESEWGFSRLPSLEELFDRAQRGRASFLDSLLSSRTFQCPDSTNSMAEAYKISHLLEALKVSPDSRHCPPVVNAAI